MIVSSVALEERLTETQAPVTGAEATADTTDTVDTENTADTADTENTADTADITDTADTAHMGLSSASGPWGPSDNPTPVPICLGWVSLYPWGGLEDTSGYLCPAEQLPVHGVS